MRRAVTESLSLALLGGVVVAVVAAVLPGRRALALDVYVLVVGALALLALGRIAHAVEATRPSSFDEALETHSFTVERPVELVRLERAVTLAGARQFDLYYRLRPMLREVADHRLRRRRGLALDELPAVSRELLGERAWELLRPDRPKPSDRLARGLPLVELRHVVDRLETI